MNEGIREGIQEYRPKCVCVCVREIGLVHGDDLWVCKGNVLKLGVFEENNQEGRKTEYPVL